MYIYREKSLFWDTQLERGENFWNFVFFIRLDWSDRLEMRVNSVEHWFSNLGTLFYFPLFELSVPVDGEFRAVGDEHKLNVFMHTCLRRILRIFWPTVIRNEELRRIANIQKVIDQIITSGIYCGRKELTTRRSLWSGPLRLGKGIEVALRRRGEELLTKTETGNV